MKLLVLDVEGTIFRSGVRLSGAELDSSIWQAVARALGPEAEEEEIETHRKWRRGEYASYLDWMKDSVEIHRRHGLTRDAFEKLITSTDYNPGVMDTISSVDRGEFEIMLVSGGFRELAARAQRDLRIVHAFAGCEYLFGDDGRVLSYNLLPCDFEGKIDFIRLMLREYGLKEDDWIFVGDGANDAPVASEAPVSIGYRPHPELEEVVEYSIKEFGELLRILSEIESSKGKRTPDVSKNR